MDQLPGLTSVMPGVLPPHHRSGDGWFSYIIGLKVPKRSSKRKSPQDVNVLAVSIVEEGTKAGKDPLAVALGRRGGVDALQLDRGLRSHP